MKKFTLVPGALEAKIKIALGDLREVAIDEHLTDEVAQQLWDADEFGIGARTILVPVTAAAKAEQAKLEK
jgi:hypothetical protein